MRCNNCNNENPEGVGYCNHCGAKITNIQNNENYTGEPINQKKESFGWAILGFFIPFVGLILFCAWKKTRKDAAKKAGIGAFVGVITAPILTVLLFRFIVWNGVEDLMIKQTCSTYCTNAEYDSSIKSCVCPNGTVIPIE